MLFSEFAISVDADFSRFPFSIWVQWSVVLRLSHVDTFPLSISDELVCDSLTVSDIRIPIDHVLAKYEKSTGTDDSHDFCEESGEVFDVGHDASTDGDIEFVVVSKGHLLVEACCVGF